MDNRWSWVYIHMCIHEGYYTEDLVFFMTDISNLLTMGVLPSTCQDQLLSNGLLEFFARGKFVEA